MKKLKQQLCKWGIHIWKHEGDFLANGRVFRLRVCKNCYKVSNIELS